MLALGCKPCRYSDCIHYIEDCAPDYYIAHVKCGRCLYAYYPKPKSFFQQLFKPKEKKDRFRDKGLCQKVIF